MLVVYCVLLSEMLLIIIVYNLAFVLYKYLQLNFSEIFNPSLANYFISKVCHDSLNQTVILSQT